jgi:hypothetical protein
MVQRLGRAVPVKIAVQHPLWDASRTGLRDDGYQGLLRGVTGARPALPDPAIT